MSSYVTGEVLTADGGLLLASPFQSRARSPPPPPKSIQMSSSGHLSGKQPKHWGQPRFDGKSIMVTGGDSGIGLAAVKAFYTECGNVMMVGHNPQKTKEAAENVTSLPLPVACASKPK